MHDILKRALNARVADVLPQPTALDRAPNLSARLGVPVLLKREDLTPIFSFKLRGAYNRLARLNEAERAAGVIAASAGNHAQGVAYVAARLGLRCRIVMPRTTPAIKVEAVRRSGAAIELAGDDYTQAAEHCAALASATGMTLIPPYDDLDVIAGQATIGLEILRQAPRDLATIFVPVGGGGLAAGVAAVVKELRPEVRVVGVEPDDSDAMTRSLREGRRVVLDHVGIFADGVAVRQVGAHTFAMCRQYLDGCLTVGADEICAAIKDVFEDTRSVLEPAGALAVAGLKRAAQAGDVPAGTAVAIASGANMNFTRLRYVTERAEIGEHREAIFAVTIPERPGSFLEFCRTIGERSVTEFNYRLATRDEAHIFVGIEVSGREEARALAATLAVRGYACVDLTENDLAKTHVRHMVGGRTASAAGEVLFSFEFPERPGALMQFLSNLGARWNISLFHYRNHGAAFGRVLCGFEVPPNERAQLLARLAELGFTHGDETDNPAARFFLRKDTPMAIVLYHWRDARSLRALWTLEEMDLEYELETLPFPPRVLQRDYLEVNPLGTVPYMIDGDVRMSESSGICHYLVERYGPTPLAVPVADADYGRYLNWLYFSDATLTFPQTIYLRYSALEPEERRLPQAAEDYKRWFAGRLRAVETATADREFLCAGRFTIADICIGYALHLARNIGLGEVLGPNANRYFDQLKQRPAFQRAASL